MTPLALVLYGAALAVGRGGRLAAPHRGALRLHRRAGAAQPRAVAALRRRPARMGDRRRPGVEGGAPRSGRRPGGDRRDSRPQAPLQPRVVRLARACASQRSSASMRSSRRMCWMERPARRPILYGLRHGLVPVVAYFLGRSLILSRDELRRIGWAVLGAGAALAVGGLDRPVRRGRRVVARLRRGRLLPLRARLRLSRPRRPAGQLGVQHRGRPLPPARGELHQPAGDGVRARCRPPALGDRLADTRRRPLTIALVALCAGRAPLHALALVAALPRRRVRRPRGRPPALVAGRAHCSRARGRRGLRLRLHFGRAQDALLPGGPALPGGAGAEAR